MQARERRALTHFARLDGAYGPPPRGIGGQTMLTLRAAGYVMPGSVLERGLLVCRITDEGVAALRAEATDVREVRQDREHARNRRQYVRLRKFHRENQ